MSDARIVLGDCVEVLRSCVGDSFDSLVTDPPAGIAFMGKAWDSFESLVHFQDEMAEVFKECLRVLKPGAHGLVWALPRTSHHTGMALERAGFELRDMVLHLFGCLSDDSEVMTAEGWKPYYALEQGELALGYDLETRSFSWQPIEKVYVYPYSDTAYRLLGDRTDQIVSRGHRCIVERGGRQVFECPETLELEETVPVLENMQSLLDALPLPHEGAGNAERSLFQNMRSKVVCDGEETRPEAHLRSLWGSLPAEKSQGFEAREVLHSQVQCSEPLEVGGRAQAYEGDSSTWQSGMDGRESRVSPSKVDGCWQSSVARWSHVQTSEGQLRAGAVHQGPGGVLEDGAQGWVRGRASDRGGSGFGTALDPIRSSASPQPHYAGQPCGEPGFVCVEQRPQTVRALRFTSSDLVRVEPIQYDGIVFCIRVRTGAFVARRAGKPFITGNTGMPKGLNVAKAGAGTWEGWNTTLKPSHEVWWLVRKPLSEKTVVAQVLATGTGAINVDACRVEYDKPLDEVYREAGSPGKSSGKPLIYGNFKGVEDSPITFDPKGRWPANTVLSHSEGCKDECVEGCPVATLDEQSGVSRSAGGRVMNITPSQVYGHGKGFGVKRNLSPEEARGDPGYGDTGGASRFFYTSKVPASERTLPDGTTNNHPTVKSVKLMRYFVKLVTPPGGTVLDPFTGSGTTGVAAKAEGMSFFGVEKDPEHHRVATLRVNGPVPKDDVVRVVDSTKELTEADLLTLALSDD